MNRTIEAVAVTFFGSLFLFFLHCFLSTFKKYNIQLSSNKKIIKEFYCIYLKNIINNITIVSGRIFRLSIVLSVVYLLFKLCWILFVVLYIFLSNFYYRIEPIKKPIKDEKIIIKEEAIEQREEAIEQRDLKPQYPPSDDLPGQGRPKMRSFQSERSNDEFRIEENLNMT